MAINIKNSYPVVLGRPTESGKLWSFWCPFCKRHHYHAARRGLYQPLCPPEIAKRVWPNGYYLTLEAGSRKKRSGHQRAQDVIVPTRG